MMRLKLQAKDGARNEVNNSIFLSFNSYFALTFSANFRANILLPV